MTDQALRTFLIIANPTSGRGRGRAIAESVADLLRRAGRNVEVQYTTRGGDAHTLAAQALCDPRIDCLVACGGDGTVQQVAAALAEARQEAGQDHAGAAESKSEASAFFPKLGIAPSGRCNDFARVLGIATHPQAIAAALLHGRGRAIDLGMANGRFFCTVATLGLDAEVSRFVDRMRLPLLRGTPAYLFGLLCVLARYRPRQVRLEGDFGMLDGPLMMASTGNTCCYGGAIRIVPQADPTDGLLHVCIIRMVSRLRIPRILVAVLRGRHGELPEVSFVTTRRMRVESVERLEMWADGEHLADTPLDIRVVSAAIEVMTPVQGGQSRA